jgi:Flp pilus assembly protein TadD
MREWRPWVQSPFFPALIALVIYAPSLSFDRTLDDIVQVPAPGDHVFQSWSQVWTQPYWKDFSGGGLFRPVTSATFWAEAKLDTPIWSRHLVNVFLNALVTLLLVRLALALGLGALTAIVAGLLFALHPSHVEAVAGLVGRAELLAALWMLLALHWHNRALLKDRVPAIWLPLFAALAFLAAGSKESAWTLAVFALPLHAIRRAPLRKGWAAFAGYTIGLFAHLLLRHHTLGGWVSAPGQIILPDENALVTLHGLSRLAGGLRVAGVFFAHLVLPWRLSPDYSGTTVPITGGLLDLHFLAGCLLLVGLPLLLWTGWRKRETAFGAACLVAGVWVGTAFLLTMNVFFNLATTVADRLLYWPSAGWTIVAAAIVFEFKKLSTVTARAFAAATSVALLIAYTLTTAAYQPVWKNNLTLFDYAHRVAPTSPRVWSAYGRALADVDRNQEALDALHQSQRLSPGYQLPWAQEAALLIGIGRFDEAKAPLAEALKIFPGDPASRLNEAILWMHEGRFKDAIPRLREILDKNPNEALAQGYLALALEYEGTPEEADAAWRSYLELSSNDAAGMNEMARALATSSRGAPRAEFLTRRAIEIDPQNPRYLDTLGEALFQEGKFEEAASTWRRYLEQVPRDPEVLNDLAWILATRLNQPQEAEGLARKAVALVPDNPSFRDTLAESLWRQGKKEEASQVAKEALALEDASPDLQRFLIPKH